MQGCEAVFWQLLASGIVPIVVFDGGYDKNDQKIFQNIKLPKKSKDGSEHHRRIKGLLLYLAKESRWHLAP